MHIIEEALQKKLFITTIGKTKILTRIDLLLESFIQGSIIYPLQEIPFEYYTDEKELNHIYSFDNIKELIQETYLMYTELLNNRKKILDDSSEFPRGHLSAISGMWWGGRMSGFSSSTVEELQKNFNPKYFNKRTEKRMENDVRRLISDLRFPFKILKSSDYEKAYCDALSVSNEVIDLDAKINFNEKLTKWKKYL